MSKTRNEKRDSKRTEMIWVRATPEERAIMESKAKAAGLPLSSWLRFLALTATALLLALALPARALDHWTWQDTAWEAGTVATLAADWSQTRDMAWLNSHQIRNGRRYPVRGEGNPILGRHPSEQGVNLYFASAIVAHAAVSALLPSGWRRAWQASTVGVELMVVGGNVHAGLSFRF